MHALDHEHSAKSSTRRQFLGSAFAASMAVTIVPRHVLGGVGFTAPSEQVRLAGIGAGGMGGGDINQHTKNGAALIAVADVDEQRASGTFNKFPNAKRYKDFRELLDKEEKNIDAVTVGTPDHIHALAAMKALRMGKHVYCQKPLTHTIFEARSLAKVAAEMGVATQMGNQGHGSEGARLTVEWIRAGVIGEVREVHCWSDRSGGWWPQGIEKPTTAMEVPSTLDWDLWLGPAPQRDFHSDYVPFKWRGWWDFGTGALGDMGCHIIDHPVWALDLGAPLTVEARHTIQGSRKDNKLNFETYPISSLVHYTFAARDTMPAVSMTWYDGGLMPPTPTEMKPGESLPTNGVLYVGTKGKMYHGSHGGTPHLLPHELHEEAVNVEQTIPRSRGHYEEWYEACKGIGNTVCGFDYAGPMTETVLLGVLALRKPNTVLEWNSERMEVPNAPELNEFVHKPYRKGWELA